MEGINCALCWLQFDDSTVIPKILKCGHSFCAPCLQKLSNTQPVCPNCRKPIPGAPEDYATNFALLELVHSLNSPNLKEFYTKTRLQELKNKFKDMLADLCQVKAKLFSVLDDVKKALIQIDELSQESREEKDAKDVDGAIANLEALYQSLGNATSPRHFKEQTEASSDCSNLKENIALDFDTFKIPRVYLNEILQLSETKTKIFSMAKVGNGIRYGRIYTTNNKILVCNLDLLEKPGEQISLIWFDDFKKCFGGNVKTRPFLNLVRMDGSGFIQFEIDLFNFQVDLFLKLCTGESGPSYKGSSFSIGGTYLEPSLQMNGDFLKEEQTRNIEYGDNLRFCNYTSNPNEVLLQNFCKGNFEISHHAKAVSCCNVIGKVSNPKDFDPYLINSEEGHRWKVADCGIHFNL